MSIYKFIDDFLNDEMSKITQKTKLKSLSNWLIKLSTFILVVMGSYMSIVFIMKDTKLGDKYLSPFVPSNVLTAQELIRMQQYIFTNTVRIREDKPIVTTVFTIIYFDKNGNFSTLSNENAKVSLLSWFSPSNFTNLAGIEEYYTVNEFRYKSLVTNNPSECIGNELSKTNQNRLIQLLNNPAIGNRGVLCPLLNSKKVIYGATIVYYNAPETNVLQTQTDLINTVKTYNQLNAEYINSNPKIILD